MVEVDCSFELKNHITGEYLTQGGNSDRVTVASVLANCLISCSFKGKDAVTAYKVSMKISEPDFDGKFEDAELEICERAFEENPAGYTNLVRGQVLMAIDKAKKDANGND